MPNIPSKSRKEYMTKEEFCRQCEEGKKKCEDCPLRLNIDLDDIDVDDD